VGGRACIQAPRYSAFVATLQFFQWRLFIYEFILYSRLVIAGVEFLLRADVCPLAGCTCGVGRQVRAQSANQQKNDYQK
jgi:hypothetical protein